MLLALVSTALGLSPAPSLSAPPTLPLTFTAIVTSNASGTSSAVPHGVSTMKEFYDYANKRLRKDAEDGSTKIYRYDQPIEPPFPPGRGDPTFATPKGYQFMLNNPNMTCCWLWLMDPDTKTADRMSQMLIPKRAVDVGSSPYGEHWSSVSKFPFPQSGEFYVNATTGALTRSDTFIDLPSALGPQAGTVITNTTYTEVDLSPIDESVFWVPDARPTFGKCKEFGHDPACSMQDAAAMQSEFMQMRAATA